MNKKEIKKILEEQYKRVGPVDYTNEDYQEERKALAIEKIASELRLIRMILDSRWR